MDNKRLYESIINDVSKIVKKHLNEISKETTQSAYDKATKLSSDPTLTKYERIYRKNQASNFKNYLTKLDKDDVPNKNILKSIYEVEVGDIIVYSLKDEHWGTSDIYSISPEIYKENKKILTEYIPIGICINTDNEITIMANTTIIANVDYYNNINISEINFKIKQYTQSRHYNKWKPATLKDFEYIQNNYNVIKNAIKLTNICKSNSILYGHERGYVGTDEKKEHDSWSNNIIWAKYPHYIFKTNKIEWYCLGKAEALRPILHLEYKN